MVLATPLGIRFWTKYASSPWRKVLNRGNAVKTARAMVNIGTSDKMVVKVRLPATCGKRSSLSRRAAKRNRSRNWERDKPCMGFKKISDMKQSKTKQAWQTVSHPKGRFTLAKHAHRKHSDEQIKAPIIPTWQKHPSPYWFSTTPDTVPPANWPNSLPREWKVCLAATHACAPYLQYLRSLKRLLRTSRAKVRLMLKYWISNNAPDWRWVRPHALAIWPRQ